MVVSLSEAGGGADPRFLIVLPRASPSRPPFGWVFVYSLSSRASFRVGVPEVSLQWIEEVWAAWGIGKNAYRPCRQREGMLADRVSLHAQGILRPGPRFLGPKIKKLVCPGSRFLKL